MRLIAADEVARRARAALGYSGMERKDFARLIDARGRVSASTFDRIIARSNPRGASIEELWEIADLAGVPRSFMEEGFVSRAATLADEIAELRQVIAAIASAVNLEGLEAGQRQFLDGWLRRSSSPSAAGEPGNQIQEEG